MAGGLFAQKFTRAFESRAQRRMMCVPGSRHGRNGRDNDQ
jgi:hypothetical protein